MKGVTAQSPSWPLGEAYRRHRRIWAALGAIVFVFVAGNVLVGGFLNLHEVLITLKLASFLALFGLAQMIVMAAGDAGLDLSVGYIATMAAVFSAPIMNGQNANLWLALLLAVGIGLSVGLANGVLSAYARLPSLVVTLAMAEILEGVINIYTSGHMISGAPSPLLRTLAAKSTGVLPNMVFVLAVVTLFAMIVLYRTKFGGVLFGVGENKTAAYLSGIDPRRVRAAAFVASGVIASLIGLLLIGNMGSAFKDMGSSYVLPSIAAAVVGGVSLKGGNGNFIGVCLGAVLLQALLNLLVALGLGDAGKWMGFGVVLYCVLIAYVGDIRGHTS